MASANESAPVAQVTILGKVVHKESGDGIADLLVEVFDIDAWQDPELGAVPAALSSEIGAATALTPGGPAGLSNLYKAGKRLGSTRTQTSGEFALDVVASDLTLGKRVEQRPDLVLVVLAPDEPGLGLDKRVLHFARDVRLNAGSHEAYVVRLPTALLLAHEITTGPRKQEALSTTQNRIGDYIERHTRERQFNAGVADFHAQDATREQQGRKDFRAAFIEQLRTNFGSIPITGIVASESSTICRRSGASSPPTNGTCGYTRSKSLFSRPSRGVIGWTCAPRRTSSRASVSQERRSTRRSSTAR